MFKKVQQCKLDCSNTNVFLMSTYYTATHQAKLRERDYNRARE